MSVVRNSLILEGQTCVPYLLAKKEKFEWDRLVLEERTQYLCSMMPVLSSRFSGVSKSGLHGHHTCKLVNACTRGFIE